MVPNARGLAGLMATCIQRMSPMRSSTTFTKSKSPMLTPPVVTSASQDSAPARRAASMAASSSRTSPRSTASKPLSATNERRVSRLESRIWPGCSGEPSSTSSSPVEITPTRGRGTTDTSRSPTVASSPRWPGLSTAPGSSTRSPGTTSSPTGRMWLPSGTAWVTTTVSPSGVPSVSSTITMASAPGGTGAPVMMRTASPGPTGESSPDMPARTVPATRSVTGAATVSAARTA